MVWAVLAALWGCDTGEEPEQAEDSGAAEAAESCVYDGEDEGAYPLDLEGDPACGAELFAPGCAGCHGESGEGTEQGVPLAEHVVYHTDQELLVVLLLGAGEMPPSGLSPQGNADVLAFLRQTFGEYSGEGH